MIKIETKSKIESDSGRDIVELTAKVDGRRDEIIRELYTILEALEDKAPTELHEAVAMRIERGFEEGSKE